MLIADNGSTDGSRHIARRTARALSRCRARLRRALICWHRAAHGRFVIMGDADDSYDFRRLERSLTACARRDLVMGNRFAGGSPRRHAAAASLSRQPGASLIGRAFFRSPAGDFHCGLRGFAREHPGRWTCRRRHGVRQRDGGEGRTRRLCHR